LLAQPGKNTRQPRLHRGDGCRLAGQSKPLQFKKISPRPGFPGSLVPQINCGVGPAAGIGLRLRFPDLLQKSVPMITTDLGDLAAVPEPVRGGAPGRGPAVPTPSPAAIRIRAGVAIGIAHSA
jgi:hypothetical protein